MTETIEAKLRPRIGSKVQNRDEPHKERSPWIGKSLGYILPGLGRNTSAFHWHWRQTEEVSTESQKMAGPKEKAQC